MEIPLPKACFRQGDCRFFGGCSDFLQVLVGFQCRAFVAHIPVVAAVAAQRLGLRPNQLCVHHLCKIVVRPAQIGQQIRIAVRRRVLGNGAADQVLILQLTQNFCSFCLVIFFRNATGLVFAFNKLQQILEVDYIFFDKYSLLSLIRSKPFSLRV